MSNLFAQYFFQGLNKGLSQGLSLGEKRRKEDKLFEEQQRQDNLLRMLLGGTTEDVTLSPNNQTAIPDTKLTLGSGLQNKQIGQVDTTLIPDNPVFVRPNTRPLTPQETISTASQLDSGTISKFNFLQKMLENKPVQTKYKQFGGKVYKIGDDGSIDFTNPVYEVPQEREKRTSNYITTITDPETNSKIDLHGYENPEADPKAPNTKVIDGKKYTITNRQQSGVIKTPKNVTTKEKRGETVVETLTPEAQKYISSIKDANREYQIGKNLFANGMSVVNVNGEDYTKSEFERYFSNLRKNNIIGLKTMLGGDIEYYDKAFNKFIKGKQEVTAKDEANRVVELSKDVYDAFINGKLSQGRYSIYAELINTEFGVNITDLLKKIGHIKQ